MLVPYNSTLKNLDVIIDRSLMNLQRSYSIKQPIHLRPEITFFTKYQEVVREQM